MAARVTVNSVPILYAVCNINFANQKALSDYMATLINFTTSLPKCMHYTHIGLIYGRLVTKCLTLNFGGAKGDRA